jgi:hypothetical protein
MVASQADNGSDEAHRGRGGTHEFPDVLPTRVAVLHRREFTIEGALDDFRTQTIDPKPHAPGHEGIVNRLFLQRDKSFFTGLRSKVNNYGNEFIHGGRLVEDRLQQQGHRRNDVRHLLTHQRRRKRSADYDQCAMIRAKASTRPTTVPRSMTADPIGVDGENQREGRSSHMAFVSAFRDRHSVECSSEEISHHLG